MKLSYVIEFVGEMDRAVKFYRDVLGLPLKLQSPGWSEFSTGETSLGLHPASEKNPVRSIELGFNVSPGNDCEGCAVQHAPEETGFRRDPGAIYRLRRSSLQLRRANIKRRRSALAGGAE